MQIETAGCMPTPTEIVWGDTITNRTTEPVEPVQFNSKQDGAILVSCVASKEEKEH